MSICQFCFDSFWCIFVQLAEIRKKYIEQKNFRWRNLLTLPTGSPIVLIITSDKIASICIPARRTGMQEKTTDNNE